MRFILTLALIQALAAGLVNGQKAPAKQPAAKAARAQKDLGDPAQWPIREIHVSGAQHYAPRQIVAASGLKADSTVSRETFEAVRDRLLATGCIETITWKYESMPEGGAYRVTLVITEPDQYLPWVLDRVPVDRDAFIARARQEIPMFTETIPTTEAFLSRTAALLEKMAAEKGVKEHMAGKVLLIQKDTIAVVFGPKSAPPNVAEVRFTGARAVDPRELVKSLSQVAIGMPYIEANFRMVLENQIKPMYEAAGRLRVSFPKLDIAPAANVRGVVVTVHVDEGNGYILEDVDVRGTGLSEQDLKDAGQFKTGQTVNYSDIGKGLNRITDQLKANGFMKAAYKAQRQVNEEKKTVRLTVDYDPGPQYRFGKLEIKGLDLHSEPVVRKLWAMKPGDPFRGGYPDMFLNTIRDRGIFDDLGDTKAEMKSDDKTLLVDVLLTFKGAPPKPAPKRPDW
ncbi:MAG: hypothetical protein HY821_01060 [Acidobacteria bacterium]|nr:hypothetical protein [Acidobacteriota bacterium]